MFLLSMKDVMLAQMKRKNFLHFSSFSSQSVSIARKVESNEMEITKHNSLTLKWSALFTKRILAIHDLKHSLR